MELNNNDKQKVITSTINNITEMLSGLFNNTPEQIPTYDLHLSCGICDNCNVPIMKNSGDGVNEPYDPYLYCPKKDLAIFPEPIDGQIKECEFFEADRGITIEII